MINFHLLNFNRLRRTIIITGIPEAVRKKQVELRARKYGIVVSVDYPWENEDYTPAQGTRNGECMLKHVRMELTRVMI
jgi:hypothetical protein